MPSATKTSVKTQPSFLNLDDLGEGFKINDYLSKAKNTSAITSPKSKAFLASSSPMKQYFYENTNPDKTTAEDSAIEIEKP